MHLRSCAQGDEISVNLTSRDICSTLPIYWECRSLGNFSKNIIITFSELKQGDEKQLQKRAVEFRYQFFCEVLRFRIFRMFTFHFWNGEDKDQGSAERPSWSIPSLDLSASANLHPSYEDFCNWDKYILQCRQIHSASSTNAITTWKLVQSVWTALFLGICIRAIIDRRRRLLQQLDEIL